MMSIFFDRDYGKIVQTDLSLAKLAVKISC